MSSLHNDRSSNVLVFKHWIITYGTAVIKSRGIGRFLFNFPLYLDFAQLFEFKLEKSDTSQ